MHFFHHRRRHLHHKYSSEEGIPRGVSILAWSRAVRWIGWGFGEALLPVFILYFSNTFAEMGLLASTADIAALVSLPLIGAWADKVPAKRLISWSLIIYPLVGVSYYLAGALGAAIFIVIARVINGFTWEMENVGIETYYRRAIDYKKVATSFGYMETWSHVAWISAALGGIILLRFVSIPFLLLLIAPFALVAYFMVQRVPSDNVIADKKDRASSFSSIRAYLGSINGWRSWDTRLWLLGALILFSSLVSALAYFFIPIDAYLDGANLPMVVLVTVFGAIPALFGYKLGRFADGADKYSLIGGGLIGTAIIALGLFMFPYYWFKLVAVFLAGIILELFYVAQSSLITTLGPEETYGKRGSAFEIVTVLGDLFAPLILGIGLDILGFGSVVLIVAAAGAILGLVYQRIKPNQFGHSKY